MRINRAIKRTIRGENPLFHAFFHLPPYKKRRKLERKNFTVERPDRSPRQKINTFDEMKRNLRWNRNLADDTDIYERTYECICFELYRRRGKK